MIGMPKRGVVSMALLALTALLVAGCAATDPRHAIAGRPDVHRAISDHYQRHATEDFGRCGFPYFEAVTAWAVMEQSAERTVVRVRYFYRDWSKTGDDNRGIVVVRLCEDFGERVFTVDTLAEPPVVVGMTGPTHDPRSYFRG
jgi:hypothetical protein